MTGSTTTSSTSSNNHHQQQQPIKRQMTGVKRGEPIAKRQVPMPTGSKSILSETQSKLIPQRTGVLTSSTGSNSNSNSKVLNSRASNGMKIPSGWGGGDTAGLDPSTLLSLNNVKSMENVEQTHPFIQAQTTGFRPRGSNMSNSSSIAGR